MTRDCTECDFTTTNEFNFCPDCGNEMIERTLDDFDFPLVINTACRLNVRRKVQEKTGVDIESNHNFYDDVELLFDIQVTEDGETTIIGGYDVDVSTNCEGDRL